MIVPITSTLAAILALLAVPLTIHISVRRAMIGIKAGVAHKAVFGDTGDLKLRNAIRALGNFMEYVPFAIILLALMEIQGASANLLWGICGAFVAGRYLHAVSMTFFPLTPPPRGLAMLSTYTVLLVPAWWLLTH